ncbi:MAG: YdcF family protein [Acidobacteria bacterium]|nr:YdcF family protein [Acidobacteriota bacterium]
MKRRAFFFFLVFLVVLVLLSIAALAFYESLLALVGNLLVFKKADFQQVDAAVVLAGRYPDRALQARDLLLKSKARIALVSREELLQQLRELQRLGIHPLQSGEINRRILLMSGIDPERVKELPRSSDSTWGEAQAFRGYSEAHCLRSVVVVTCKDHSFRAYLNFKEALEGTGIEVFSLPSSYCEFEPSAWWKKRDQIKTAYVELACLIAFLLGFK